MAVIKCEECGREISDKALGCPGCGAPVSTFKLEGAPAQKPIESEQAYYTLLGEQQRPIRLRDWQTYWIRGKSPRTHTTASLEWSSGPGLATSLMYYRLSVREGSGRPVSQSRGRLKGCNRPADSVHFAAEISPRMQSSACTAGQGFQ